MEQKEAKYDLVIDPNEIIVNVSNPTEVKGNISSYTIYTVHGSDISGNFEMLRRYSDFDNVRSVLIKNWPGCYVPPLPKKKVIGNNQFLFVESRRQGLSQFCKEISQLKHLWYSQEFQIFIRNKQNLEKNLKALQQENFKKISQKYTQTFKDLSTKECQQGTVKKVQNFKQSLKKISSLITTYKQIARSVFESYSNNSEQFQVLLKYLFSEYEKHFLSIYLNGATQGKLIFANPFDQRINELIQSLKKIIEEKKIQDIYILFEKEQRQIDALQDMFKSRDTYESMLKQHQIKNQDLLLEQNKLNAGKQSIFKSIMKSSIEQQKKNIQISIDLNQEKIKEMTYLCEIMSVIMANYEIPRFQQLKMKKYYQTIKNIAEFQIKFYSMKEEICDYVLQNVNIEKLNRQESN